MPSVGRWLVPIFVVGFCGCAPRDPRVDAAVKRNGDAGRGRVLFAAQCAECHGMDGSGTGQALHNVRVVNLTTALPWYSKSAIISIVLSGVPGTDMPAFPDYSDQQLADLCQFMLALPKRKAGQ